MGVLGLNQFILVGHALKTCLGCVGRGGHQGALGGAPAPPKIFERITKMNDSGCFKAKCSENFANNRKNLAPPPPKILKMSAPVCRGCEKRCAPSTPAT